MQLIVPRGIAVSVAQMDDPPRLRVVAADGSFAGEVELWAGADRIAEFASALHGFPSGPGDRREVELGSFDRAYAGGAAHFVFEAAAVSARPAVTVQLEDASRERRVTVQLSLEAASIDDFVTDLRALADALEREATASAVLTGAV
jgi:hypothetical protein